MELINATKMQAGYTTGTDSTGRESLIVVVKGTFNFPKSPKEKPPLAEEQIPLIMADTFTGKAGFSAPVYEVDYSPIKPMCDVILLGGAYAPTDKPVTQLQVGMKVANVAKTFIVVGNRHWETSNNNCHPSSPNTFTYLPLTYDCAFGGIDNYLSDENQHIAYMPNPVGKGYHKHLVNKLIDGSPLPNTEAINQTICHPNHHYTPMAFSPVGRNWEPRYHYGGTYDDEWLDTQSPFLPKDFDNRYFQCAPSDQQMTYPTGGEEVILINLSPDCKKVQFRLPTIAMPVVFFYKKGKKYESKAVIDTIVLEPNKRTFSITWRTSLALRKNIFEIPQILVGKMSNGWWRAHTSGKTWYPSLAHLAKAKRQKSKEQTI